MEAFHLVKRFGSSLRVRPPPSAEQDWLVGLLSRSETELYRAQPVNDRRHSVECAFAARAGLGAEATRPIIVASALHDVGKADAGLSTVGRVVATLLGFVVPAARIAEWRSRSGFRGRVGAYDNHAAHGAQLLTAAGSHPTVVAWACEHHLPDSEQTLPPDIAKALWAADH